MTQTNIKYGSGEPSMSITEDFYVDLHTGCMWYKQDDKGWIIVFNPSNNTPNEPEREQSPWEVRPDE